MVDHIGIVTDIEMRPYDAIKDETNNPNSKTHYSPFNYNRILENLGQIKEVPVLHIKQDGGNSSVIERIVDLGITQSWFCALNCLSASLYDPSVLFASISVECVLNHDLRLESNRLTKYYEWLDLDVKNLSLAHDKGLPSELLLNPSENFQMTTIEFVNRRNKVAHGDLKGYNEMYPRVFDPKFFDPNIFQTGRNRPSQHDAIDQMNKAKNFIVGWANQTPRIRLH